MVLFSLMIPSPRPEPVRTLVEAPALASTDIPIPESRREHMILEISRYIRDTNPIIEEPLALAMARTYKDVSEEFDIDVKILLAKDYVESRFNPNAFSTDSSGTVLARGVAQFMVSTGKFVWGELGYPYESPDCLYVPDHSIRAGAWYLRFLIDRFQSVEKALIAYNIGETRLARIVSNGGNLPSVYSYLVREQIKILNKTI